MASGFPFGDQDLHSLPASLTSSAPQRYVSSSASKHARGSQGRVSDSETTPLLHRIVEVPEHPHQGGNYGTLQSGVTTKLSEDEIPFWQTPPMWSTGLFDCCADVPMCCFTILFPCLAFGRNAEALDGIKHSCWTAAGVWWVLQHTTALGCLYSSAYRGKLRAKYNIPEGPVPDTVIHCLCWPCAFCQEHREIHYRSFGPESWGHTLTVAPAQQQIHSPEAKNPGKYSKWI